jgi:hypothetical protein
MMTPRQPFTPTIWAAPRWAATCFQDDLMNSPSLNRVPPQMQLRLRASQGWCLRDVVAKCDRLCRRTCLGRKMSLGNDLAQPTTPPAFTGVALAWPAHRALLHRANAVAQSIAISAICMQRYCNPACTQPRTRLHQIPQGSAARLRVQATCDFREG